MTVELLRKGTPHNQLLSPLTDYIGICGDAGAGSVTVPYEHSSFSAVLEDLRYTDFEEEEQAPRQRALRTLGRNVGEMLGSIPGFNGSLASNSAPGDMINLRIVTSASELSLLPFELAKMPNASGRSMNDWLGIQAATPICITRRSRSVPTRSAIWRGDETPRVLYIVGLDIDEELAEQHRLALMEALDPWVSVRQRGNPQFDAVSELPDVEDLTEAESEIVLDEITERVGLNWDQKTDVLVEMSPFAGELPTMPAIREMLATGSGFTHVHILAHGAESEESEGSAYGIFLPGTESTRRQPSTMVHDIVTGDRFASMLSSIPRDNWPSVVFAASCDSANQAGVLVPGGSFGHALHEAGLPLVVASQFPLTTEGSVTLARTFYGDVFWGWPPLPSLARARAILHSENAYAHDWASIVVYDGLPDDMAAQALACRYARSCRALEVAQELLLPPGWATHLITATRPDEMAEDALAQMPDDGGYRRDSEALRGGHAKRQAVRSFWTDQEIAQSIIDSEVDLPPDELDSQIEAQRASYNGRSRVWLYQARDHYRQAANAFLDPRSAMAPQTSLHWVLTKAISLGRLLGDTRPDSGWESGDDEAFVSGAERRDWEVAFHSATVASARSDVGGASALAWSHAALAELWLLKLCEKDLSAEGCRRAKEKAERHAVQVRKLRTVGRRGVTGSSGDPVEVTRQQFNRYATEWTAEFRAGLGLPLEVPPDRKDEELGRWQVVRELAEELQKVLSGDPPTKKEVVESPQLATYGQMESQ